MAPFLVGALKGGPFFDRGPFVGGAFLSQAPFVRREPFEKNLGLIRFA